MNIQTVKKIKNDITDVVSNDYVELIDADSNVFCVPKNTANRHYQAILEWVADGNTIEAAD